MQNIDIKMKALSAHLDKLLPFYYAAELGSVSKAAIQLNMSQSALSHLLKSLEETLDFSLFNRYSRGIRLTDKGEAFLIYSKRVLEESERFCEEIYSKGGLATQIIRGGSHETLVTHIWPKFLQLVKVNSPGLKVSVISGRIDGLVEMIKSGQLDFIVSVEPQPAPWIKISPIYSGALEFFSGPDFKVPGTSITLNALKGVPIFTDINAHVRQGISIPSVLANLGLSGLSQFEVASFEASINLAASGLGIALLPGRNARSAVKEKRLVPIKIQGVSGSKELRYKICLSRPKSSPKEQTLDGLLKSFESLQA